MQVIIVNGVARAGKDTFVEMARDHLERLGRQSRLLSTVTIPKLIARKFFNWDGRKSNKDRKMLSNLKDLWTGYCDGPFHYIVNEIEAGGEDTFFFVMVREPAEIKKLEKRFEGYCTSILIHREEAKVPDNHADQNVGRHQYNILVGNNGAFEQLEHNAKNVIDAIIAGRA